MSEIWEWVVAPLGDDVRGERLKEEPLNEATLGTVNFTPHSSQSTCRYFFVHQGCTRAGKAWRLHTTFAVAEVPGGRRDEWQPEKILSSGMHEEFGPNL